MCLLFQPTGFLHRCVLIFTSTHEKWRIYVSFFLFLLFFLFFFQEKYSRRWFISFSNLPWIQPAWRTLFTNIFFTVCIDTLGLSIIFSRSNIVERFCSIVFRAKHSISCLFYLIDGFSEMYDLIVQNFMYFVRHFFHEMFDNSGFSERKNIIKRRYSWNI